MTSDDDPNHTSSLVGGGNRCCARDRRVGKQQLQHRRADESDKGGAAAAASTGTSSTTIGLASSGLGTHPGRLPGQNLVSVPGGRGRQARLRRGLATARNDRETGYGQRRRAIAARVRRRKGAAAAPSLGTRRGLPMTFRTTSVGPTSSVARAISTNALAVRQIEARAMLRRLGDCSRKLERIGATSRAFPRNAEGDRVRQLVRALTTEAARLRRKFLMG